MTLTLRFRSEHPQPIDASALAPDRLGSLGTEEIRRISLPCGREKIPIGELFEVSGNAGDLNLEVAGNLASLNRLGAEMASGRLGVHGSTGAELGRGMTGGAIRVEGNVGAWAGAEMRGGLLRIRGNAGSGLGASPSGGRGLRGGTILVEGDVGPGAGCRMRRGLLAVRGRADEGFARGIISGTCLLEGTSPVGLAAGMRAGTVVALAGDEPVLPTFRETGRVRPVFVRLLWRTLGRLEFPLNEPMGAAPFRRFAGDLVDAGAGEILVPSS